jgi:hypothetical protein
VHRSPARWSLICAATLALVAITAGSSIAQTAPGWHLVQGSDGTLYVVTGQTRYPVSPDQISDGDLAALNDGGALGSQIPASPPAAAVPTAAVPVVAADVWTPPAPTKISGCASQGGLPDPACNPGAVDPRVNQADITSTICTRGYTETVRPPVNVTEKIKRDQMAAYGLQGQRLADNELDHLLS